MSILVKIWPSPSFLYCLGLGKPLFEVSSGQTPEESGSQSSTVWIPRLVIETYPLEPKEVLAMKPLPGFVQARLLPNLKSLKTFSR